MPCEWRRTQMKHQIRPGLLIKRFWLGLDANAAMYAERGQLRFLGKGNRNRISVGNPRKTKKRIMITRTLALCERCVHCMTLCFCISLKVWISYDNDVFHWSNFYCFLYENSDYCCLLVTCLNVWVHVYSITLWQLSLIRTAIVCVDESNTFVDLPQLCLNLQHYATKTVLFCLVAAVCT